MKRTIYFFTLFLFLFSSMLMSAMDQPAPDAKILKNFGTNDRGQPVLGESFAAAGNIFAADSGEIFFSVSEGDAAQSFASPLGDWIAVDHGEGLIGIYARGKESEVSEKPKKVGKDTVMARAEKSGWTDSEGFYFSFYDRKERRWINPAMIVGAMLDTIAPAIQSVKLRGENGQTIALESTRVIKQGRYAIEVEAADRSESAANATAPYRIICSLNGAEVGILALETLSARDGVLMMYRNGLVPASRIYAPYPALEVASDLWFTRGMLSLDVIVQDYNKNTRNAGYRIFVE
ncbi:MAG: hypothetical protein LBT01_06625 [Spirochaetaceae bacterium]|nr:hypothetical protein [Spirochaetaceae bacterium]